MGIRYEPTYDTLDLSSMKLGQGLLRHSSSISITPTLDYLGQFCQFCQDDLFLIFLARNFGLGVLLIGGSTFDMRCLLALHHFENDLYNPP